MEAENASLCNMVIKYLLDQQYLLTAFELMHELIEDGHGDRATRLEQFFSDAEAFPPHEMLRLQTLQVVNPQRVVEERDAAEEKSTLMEYELRLAKEDLKRLQEKLYSQHEAQATAYSENGDSNFTLMHNQETLMDVKNKALGRLRDPLREGERRALDWGVKEYLLLAGYKLSAMTFYEEVGQDLDTPPAGPAHVPDALRCYYHHFLAACPEELEEKALLQGEKEQLLKEKEDMLCEKEKILKNKQDLEAEIVLLKSSLESSQKDAKDKERKMIDWKESCEQVSTNLNECRMEITALKLELDSLRTSRGHNKDDIPPTFQEQLNSYQAQMEALKNELDSLRSKQDLHGNEHLDSSVPGNNRNTIGIECSDVTYECSTSLKEKTSVKLVDLNTSPTKLDREDMSCVASENSILEQKESRDIDAKNTVETVEILADALPKIVPYVLINHREELLPLIMCAIERHPDSSVRDVLTHTLFNLIKRPDENQRRIIMEACVSLSKSIGEERTELELLPQCWEQINHKYEERRLLVAQSCGELAQFVKADIRTSLILSIVQQLIEDAAAVVREAAAHNLAVLLPLFPSMDKYFKVEELMFQLVLDPAGVVVDKTLKELVPAVIAWSKSGNEFLSHILRVLLSHLLGSIQHCTPVSGVEGSMEARLRVLGERERWNVDVLLRMLTELMPEVLKLVKHTCPYSTESMLKDEEDIPLSDELIVEYLRGHQEWSAFEWLHTECLPLLLQLACMLPTREDSLRTRLSKLILVIIKCFGNQYLLKILLPIFFIAVGDNADIAYFPARVSSRINALKPKSDTDERLATLCVLPLLLAGVLGATSMHDQLTTYLRSLVVQHTSKHGALTPSHSPELLDSIRFLCTFEEHHCTIIAVLWELVVESNADLKISAASIFKVLVPYVDARIATQDIMPALVTLGSDPNLLVKYSSIDAFGAVAQHFKDDVIVDKIKVQMDTFLEDGSHEATVAVVRTLAVAVPLSTPRMRDYLLQKLVTLTSVTTQGANLMRRRDRADAFCEAVRALDAADLSATTVRDLIPAIQNLLKDTDALDPAHKEALELILKERAGGRLESLTKAMGTHLSFSGVTSLFGDTGLLVKKDNVEVPVDPQMTHPPPPVPEESRLFNRLMRTNLGDMIRGRGETK